MESSTRMDLETYNKIVELLKEYSSCSVITSFEFIEAKLESPESTVTENQVKCFSQLMYHEQFLDVVAKNIIRHHSLKKTGGINMKVFIYVIIFHLYKEIDEQTFSFITHIKCPYKDKILNYFSEERNLMEVAVCGCKLFEDQYIIDNIITPLVTKAYHLKKLEMGLKLLESDKPPKKPDTIPMNLNVLNHRKKSPVVPLNTPEKIFTFVATDVPRSTYFGNRKPRHLEEEYEKNHARAAHLLKKAKSLSVKYVKPAKPVAGRTLRDEKFKTKKVAQMTDVPIKGTVTTVLREAKTCIKEQEDEIRAIEKIMEGDGSLERYKIAEENSRLLENQELISNIQRKHLEGLLTFEEAITAKKKLLEYNKERYKQFKEEQLRFLEELDRYREQEQDRIKKLVEKSHAMELGAKNAEEKLREDKKIQADEVKSENHKLLFEAAEIKNRELMKKVQLIKEIKSLHQMKMLQIQNAQEFDRAERPNVGLLCEMSIADLRKQLMAAKIAMQEEIERRRRCIAERKSKKTEMIENVNKFIAESRMLRVKPRARIVSEPEVFKSDPELEKLRARLETLRRFNRDSKVVENEECDSACACSNELVQGRIDSFNK